MLTPIFCSGGATFWQHHDCSCCYQGQRPTKTACHALSLIGFTYEVRNCQNEEWYFTDDSMVPESPLQSLPPILRINSTAPIRSYSKAPGVFSSICRQAASLPPLYFHRAGPRDSFPLVTPFVHVGTYPTRKYALFFLLERQALLVCAPIGLYLHLHQEINQDGQMSSIWSLVGQIWITLYFYR